MPNHNNGMIVYNCRYWDKKAFLSAVRYMMEAFDEKPDLFFIYVLSEHTEGVPTLQTLAKHIKTAGYNLPGPIIIDGPIEDGAGAELHITCCVEVVSTPAQPYLKVVPSGTYKTLLHTEEVDEFDWS